MKDVLYIVVPCYNESEVILDSSEKLLDKLNELIDNKLVSPESKIFFVNDGSKDDTWIKIKNLHKENPVYTGISLSRNRGHQNALTAGLLIAKDYCDITISIDADLQDDLEVFDTMIKHYKEGCDIVYGVRSSRKTDSWFKKTTAESFYKLMLFLGVETVYNHADFRLMSKAALEAFSLFEERNLCLRGMVPMLGFKTETVLYERKARLAGESKYPFSKMLILAIEGITSLSVKPIRYITMLGFLIFMFSVAMLIWSIVGFFNGATMQGWSSIMVSVWGIGGIIILSLGVIGEYVGKIYLEVKKRPRYIIAENLADTKNIDEKLLNN